jgi:hypothetical protein
MTKILIITDRDKPGNYFEKVQEAIQSNPPKPGTINHVSIAHDDGCGIFRGKPCDCDPDIELLGQEQ